MQQGEAGLSESPAGGSVPPCITTKHYNAMKQHMTHIAMLLAVTLAACSCSVREDRADCPCWLKVFIEPFPKDGAVISAYSAAKVFSERVSAEQYGGCFETSVPRAFLGVSCHNSPESMMVSGSLVTIPEGEQCDSLYAHHAVVDCTGEEATDRARLCKQFATVYLTFENPDDADRCPYGIRISGTIDGIDMQSFTPHEGAFRYTPAEQKPFFYCFRLPRQKDDALILELYSREDGTLVDSLSLGEHIRESGFDWQAESLDDIVITVNLSKAEVEISVSGWDADKVYDVTI